MAVNQRKINENLRKKYLEKMKNFLEKEGEEVLVTGTNEICFPCVDEIGEDKFLQIIIKVPKGSRDGEAFDGYSLAEDFLIKQKLKEEKRKEDEIKKKKKIEKDKMKREEKRE